MGISFTRIYLNKKKSKAGMTCFIWSVDSVQNEKNLYDRYIQCLIAHGVCKANQSFFPYEHFRFLLLYVHIFAFDLTGLCLVFSLKYCTKTLNKLSHLVISKQV